MGKTIISQARGRGGPRYRAPSHRYLSSVKYLNYSEKEKTSMVIAKIIDLEHCPGHSAPLAKIQYETGEIDHIFAPENVKVDDIIQIGMNAETKYGNIKPLKSIQDGTLVYNLELRPGDGGRICRAAGSSAKIISHTKDKVIIELPSKKQKEFNELCRATIGIIAGSGKGEKPFVKAGNKFHAMQARNKLYPRTSAVSMNAVDHPFGSGRGSHAGNPTIAPRFAPPGRKVGKLRPRRTGKR